MTSNTIASYVDFDSVTVDLHTITNVLTGDKLWIHTDGHLIVHTRGFWRPVARWYGTQSAHKTVEVLKRIFARSLTVCAFTQMQWRLSSDQQDFDAARRCWDMTAGAADALSVLCTTYASDVNIRNQLAHLQEYVVVSLQYLHSD
jgi:hypothetical protein